MAYCIVLAMITYSVMFHKYRKSLTVMILCNRETGDSRSGGRLSVLKTFVQSKFCIPVLLITTFLSLIALPDIIHSAYIINGHPTKKLAIVARFLYNLSDTCDAIIYLFFQKKVRDLICRKLYLFKICCQRDDDKTKHPNREVTRGNNIRESNV